MRMSMAAGAHGLPTLRGQMVESSLGQDGSTGIAGAQKENIHGSNQIEVAEVKTMEKIQSAST